MKVFITGGTGFIGSYVIKNLLKDGITDIIATKRKSSKMDLAGDLKNKIQWETTDLFDTIQLGELIQDRDAIIHVAGSVSFSPRYRNTVFRTNVEATSNLINTAIDKKVNRFIHFSSVAAFGLSNKIIDEKTVWNENSPQSVYQLSKYLGEREAWRGYAEGLNISIINPSFVLGGSYWKTGPLSMISKISKGLKYYPIGTNGVVDVRDVAKMCVQLLLRTDMGGKQFICNADNISHLGLMKMMCDHLDQPYPNIPLSGLLGEAAWRLESFKSRIQGTDSLFSKEAYTIASSGLSYNNLRSKELLGFKYIPIGKSVKDTIDCYVESMKNNTDYGILK